jgi:RimJ/RimL family protein N-acetyltransferase
MGAGDEEITPIRIETDCLVLRDVVESDVDGFHAYMADPAYIRHLPLDPMDRAAVQALVDRVLLRQGLRPRERYFLAAIERTSGRLVGEAIFKQLSDVEGEIGWGVAGPDQGRGLATEIGRALLRFGFEALGLHRLIARCEVGNHASERVMAKLGMVREGILREHLFARGRWWSSVQWSILAPESSPLPLAGEGAERQRGG